MEQLVVLSFKIIADINSCYLSVGSSNCSMGIVYYNLKKSIVAPYSSAVYPIAAHPDPNALCTGVCGVDPIQAVLLPVSYALQRFRLFLLWLCRTLINKCCGVSPFSQNLHPSVKQPARNPAMILNSFLLRKVNKVPYCSGAGLLNTDVTGS